jgi:hypothetical protein
MRWSRSIYRILFLFPLVLSLFLGIASCGSNHPSTKNSPSTVLSIVGGNVLIQKSGSSDWIDGKEGMTLEAGDIIQTGNESSAKITFFEGSTIELNTGSQLEITSLDIAKSGTTTILLKQKMGETVSRVIKLADPKSRYEIETISAVAAVRGSTMIVDIAPNGATSVGNEEGTISIIAQGIEVAVPVGSHSVALPGQPPAEPEPGITLPTISSAVYTDPVGDLFDKNGNSTTGENYLDIVKSQISLTAGLYTVHIELNEHCPQQTSEPTTFIEWDILIDTDTNANTGTKWPLIGNDIGYDYMARMTLQGTQYGQGLLKVNTNTWSDIDYLVAVYNWQKVGNIIELYIPASAIGSPDSFNWIIAVRKYMSADPPNLPSVSDKAPNQGHFVFP